MCVHNYKGLRLAIYMHGFELECLDVAVVLYRVLQTIFSGVL